MTDGEYEAEVLHQDDMQLTTHPWSAPEKQMLCQLMPVSNVLNYPMQKRQAANGDFEAVYLIPKEDKAKVLAQCWPAYSRMMREAPSCIL